MGLRLSKLFNKRAVNIALGASLAVSGLHGGASIFRKLTGPQSGEAKDQPTEAVHRQMVDGLDALNTAYPTGSDGVWGSRDDQFTRGWFAEVSGAAKESFDFVESVSDTGGSHDGLHAVLLRHKESQNLIFAVCGMEVPAEHIAQDLPDVFNSLHIFGASLPDQFPQLVKAFDALETKHGPIDLVAGHSIGAMLTQLLAGGRDVQVVAFSSAGLSRGLVDQCAVYFDLPPDTVLDNMHNRCVSVPATNYSLSGDFHPGDNYWPASAAPTNLNMIQHGSFEASQAIKDGEFITNPNVIGGAFLPSALIAGVGSVLLAANNLLRKKPVEVKAEAVLPTVDPSSSM